MRYLKLIKEKKFQILCKGYPALYQKADKCSAIEIMQTTDYLHKGYRQLGPKHFYTKLKGDPTISISDKICQVLTGNEVPKAY